MLAKRVEEWSQQIREQSRTEALKEGRREGRQEGWQEGRREGRREGRQEGWQEGRREGRREGEATLLLRQLERKFGRLDEQTRKLVRDAEPQRLLDWADRVLTAERLEDVFAEGS